MNWPPLDGMPYSFHHRPIIGWAETVTSHSNKLGSQSSSVGNITRPACVCTRLCVLLNATLQVWSLSPMFLPCHFNKQHASYLNFMQLCIKRSIQQLLFVVELHIVPYNYLLFLSKFKLFLVLQWDFSMYACSFCWNRLAINFTKIYFILKVLFLKFIFTADI